MKKIIILKSGGGELANQLWNYMSIWAWGREEKAPVTNPSFFEYHSQFDLLSSESFLTKALSLPFGDYRGRKQDAWKRLWRKIYAPYPKIVAAFRPGRILSSENSSNQVTYLPPTASLFQPGTATKGSQTIYTSGWLFRNPKGLQKYREDIIKSFTPKKEIQEKVGGLISASRKQYVTVMGVHIRQWDYRTFKGGKYFMDQKRVREIIDQYSKWRNLNLASTIFIITSDGTVDPGIFAGLNIHVSTENAVTDLFLLSKTDAIIGSDSSFGHLASWYGDIPHIVMQKEEMDWKYYEDKRSYFENKYCTMVHF